MDYFIMNFTTLTIADYTLMSSNFIADITPHVYHFGFLYGFIKSHLVLLPRQLDGPKPPIV